MMASPPQPRRRWLLESAGAAFQHVLTASHTASTNTYDTKVQAEHCPNCTVPYAYEPGLIARLLGPLTLEAVNAYGVQLLRI